ncbi:MULTISPECIES: lipopolysaccharide assembly protein LapA domain-containing protein [unclassified Gordonia (in: high G+C Gram-positive bacteria)]
MANETTSPAPAQRGSSPVLGFLKRYWLPLVLVIVATIFIFQNTQEIRINLLMFHISTWQWLMLAIVGAAGVVVGWFLGRSGKKSK